MKNSKKSLFISMLLLMSLVHSCVYAAVPSHSELFNKHSNYTELTKKEGFAAGEALPKQPVQTFELRPAIYSYHRIGFSKTDNINPNIPPSNVATYNLGPVTENGKVLSTRYTTKGNESPLFIWYIIKSNKRFKIEVTGEDLTAETDTKGKFRLVTTFTPKGQPAMQETLHFDEAAGKYNTVVLMDETKKGKLNVLRQGSCRLDVEAQYVTMDGGIVTESQENTILGVPYRGTYTVNITVIETSNEVAP